MGVAVVLRVVFLHFCVRAVDNLGLLCYFQLRPEQAYLQFWLEHWSERQMALEVVAEGALL